MDKCECGAAVGLWYWEEENRFICPPCLAKIIEELRQWKEDVEESHRKVMQEKCPSDEVHCTCVPILRREYKQLERSLKIYKTRGDLVVKDSEILAKCQKMVKKQAEDEGLWFDAETAPEAYLQQEMRKLHAVIEDRTCKG